ncbi:MAG: peptidase M19 [Calditrichaeota bacterium]|nr:MAG: peptidase M19 [Calditrichota bacterium]
MKTVILWALVFLGALVLMFLIFFASVIEKRLNRVLPRKAFQPTEKAKNLHQKIFIADLHCDALLWRRNLLRKHTYGHVDIPRLIEANVGLQAFTIVSKVPFGLNIERNEGKRDLITLLAISQRWPVRTWWSLKQRALYQAQKLQRFAERSNGHFSLIRSRQDLQHYLEQRKQNPQITAGFLGVEGAQVLEGNLDNIKVLYDAGIRMMAPTHFFDNRIGGSAHGVKKGGLTELGREMIREMEQRKMIVDLAHASEQTITDVLNIATRPLLVSHTGVKATCDNPRNLSDEQIKAIAKTGGLIGIGFWQTASCGTDGRAVARAMRHVAELVGIEHLALGSDFDGAVPEPFDVTGLVEITEALFDEGFAEQDISLIMGGNVLHFLLENFP